MACINASINTELSVESQTKIKDMVASYSTRAIVVTAASEGVVEVTRPIEAADVTDADLCELVCKQVCNWVDKNEAKKAPKATSFTDAI